MGVSCKTPVTRSPALTESTSIAALACAPTAAVLVIDPFLWAALTGFDSSRQCLIWQSAIVLYCVVRGKRGRRCSCFVVARRRSLM